MSQVTVTRKPFTTLSNLLFNYLFWDGWAPWMTAPNGDPLNKQKTPECSYFESDICGLTTDPWACVNCRHAEMENGFKPFLSSHLGGYIDPILFYPRFHSGDIHIIRIGLTSGTNWSLLRLASICDKVGLNALVQSDGIYLGFAPGLKDPVANVLAKGLIRATKREGDFRIEGLGPNVSTSPYIPLPLYGTEADPRINWISDRDCRYEPAEFDQFLIADAVKTNTPLSAKQIIGKIAADLWLEEPGGPHPELVRLCNSDKRLRMALSYIPEEGQGDSHLCALGVALLNNDLPVEIICEELEIVPHPTPDYPLEEKITLWREKQYKLSGKQDSPMFAFLLDKNGDPVLKSSERIATDGADFTFEGFTGIQYRFRLVGGSYGLQIDLKATRGKSLLHQDTFNLQKSKCRVEFANCVERRAKEVSSDAVRGDLN